MQLHGIDTSDLIFKAAAQMTECLSILGEDLELVWLPFELSLILDQYLNLRLC